MSPEIQTLLFLFKHKYPDLNEQQLRNKVFSYLRTQRYNDCVVRDKSRKTVLKNSFNINVEEISYDPTNYLDLLLDLKELDEYHKCFVNLRLNEGLSLLEISSRMKITYYEVLLIREEIKEKIDVG